MRTAGSSTTYHEGLCGRVVGMSNPLATSKWNKTAEESAVFFMYNGVSAACHDRGHIEIPTIE